MAEVRRLPGRRGVAIITAVWRLEMGRGLAGHLGVVVAGEAGAGHLRVVNLAGR